MSTELLPTNPEALMRDSIHKSKVMSAYLREFPWKESWVGFRAEELATNLEVMNRTVPELLAHKVDALHGMSSAHIMSVLRHGLVPSSEHRQLGILALGREHYSQPLKRTGINVVHWMFAHETTKYAEHRVQGGPLNGQKYFVTFENAVEFAEADLGPYEEYADQECRSWALEHILGTALEARELLDRIHTGELTGAELELLGDAFPVVVGISTESIDESRLIGIGSSIEGDVSIDGRISPEALAVLYAPYDKLDRVRSFIEAESLLSEIAVLPLEHLRAIQ